MPGVSLVDTQDRPARLIHWRDGLKMRISYTHDLLGVVNSLGGWMAEL